jgi:hypothetical protein
MALAPGCLLLSDSAPRGPGVPPAAYVSIRQHTSAYVSIRQHTSANLHEEARDERLANVDVVVHIRMLTYADLCWRMLTYADLHEEARDERLANVDIVVLGAEFRTSKRQVVFCHQPRQLSPPRG